MLMTLGLSHSDLSNSGAVQRSLRRYLPCVRYCWKFRACQSDAWWTFANSASFILSVNLNGTVTLILYNEEKMLSGGQRSTVRTIWAVQAERWLRQASRSV